MTPLKGFLQVLLGPKLQGEERNLGPEDTNGRKRKGAWESIMEGSCH